jgi:hypothetical protein
MLRKDGRFSRQRLKPPAAEKPSPLKGLKAAQLVFQSVSRTLSLVKRALFISPIPFV